MIIRFLARLPSDISQRLTLREQLDPTRHHFKHFMARLHELEEAENVTKTIQTAVVDEQRQARRRDNLRQPDIVRKFP